MRATTAYILLIFMLLAWVFTLILDMKPDCHFERGECPNEMCKMYGEKAGERVEKIAIEGADRISVMTSNGAYDYLTREEVKKEVGIDVEIYTPTYETDSHFYAGQVLYPDYVHTDTLVVLDGLSLSWAMSNPNIASDEDISLILGEYTIPIEDVRYDTAYYHCIIRKQNSEQLNYNE